MRRWALLLVCTLPVGAAADPAWFSDGAARITLQYGVGLWALDRAHLASQVGDAHAGVFVDEARSSHTATIALSYNVLGHASLEAALTATGWNLQDNSRGGAGFAAGLVHWHPLELVWRKAQRPIPIDASAFFGVGYGIAGQDRGMDGRVLEAGVVGEYYLVKTVGLGLFARGVFLQFDKFYLNYDQRTASGNTMPLAKGSGGVFWTLGASLSFRFET